MYSPSGEEEISNEIRLPLPLSSPSLSSRRIKMKGKGKRDYQGHFGSVFFFPSGLSADTHT